MNDQRTDDSDLADAPLDDDAATAPDHGIHDDLTAALQEKAALQDRLLRTAAEFDNYRKRVDRERRDLSEFAAADLLSELLPIIDDLERALQAPVTGEISAYRQGVELVYRQMLDLLRKRGVKAIDAVGTDFDPNVHEAVVHEVSDEHREGEVVQELRRGYKLGERLLRPSMVKVAKRS